MRDFRNRSSTGQGAGEPASAGQPSPGKPTLVEAAQGAAVQRRADGYIKKIYNGDQEFGGGIATSGQFNRTKDEDAARTGTDYLYSSTHDQGGESFGDRIGSMAPDKAKVGGNAKGLDAVTWLAAEGARFAPVAALGSAGSPESRYFIKPNPANWTGYKFLTTSDLMQSWKEDFGKAYNIPAATMAGVVANRGKDSTVEAQPPAGVHYNLTTGARHDQG